ncbi:MAG: IclR family transcriptional regulator [Opitutaceae bacterium]
MTESESTALPDRRKHRAQTVDKALYLLSVVAESETPMALSALVRASRMEKTTTHRLAGSLADAGFLRYIASDRSYALGWKLIELGQIASSRINAVSEAEPFLRRIGQLTGETVHLGGYDAGQVVYLAQVASTERVIIRARVGQRRPAHASSLGKAMMAFGPPAWLNEVQSGELEAVTPNTIVSSDELIVHLDRVRRLGYAIDDEETNLGVRCVAFPVRDHTGFAVAAISVTGPSFRMTRERLAALAAEIGPIVSELSLRMGYGPSDRQPSAH